MDFPRALSVALRRALFQLRRGRPVAPPVATAVSPGMSTGGGSATSRGPLVQPERKRRAEEPVRPARRRCHGPRSPRGGFARGPCTARSPRGRGGQAQERPQTARRVKGGQAVHGRCMWGGAVGRCSGAVQWGARRRRRRLQSMRPGACAACLPLLPGAPAHRPTRLWHACTGSRGSSSGSSRGARQHRLRLGARVAGRQPERSRACVCVCTCMRVCLCVHVHAHIIWRGGQRARARPSSEA